MYLYYVRYKQNIYLIGIILMDGIIDMVIINNHKLVSMLMIVIVIVNLDYYFYMVHILFYFYFLIFVIYIICIWIYLNINVLFVITIINWYIMLCH